MIKGKIYDLEVYGDINGAIWLRTLPNENNEKRYFLTYLLSQNASEIPEGMSLILMINEEIKFTDKTYALDTNRVINEKQPKTMSWAVMYRVELGRKRNYLFENCGARRAFLRPYFLRSTILASLVRNPAFLISSLSEGSASFNALATPCLIAPA